MNLLKDFLKRFERIEDPQVDKQKISKEISLLINTNIDSSKVSLRNGTVFVSDTSPIVRNEIFLKKEKILASINEKYPKICVRDIH